MFVNNFGSIALIFVQFHFVECYYRKPCSRHTASDFSFPDCYLPDQPDDLLLSDASFLLSHDAATGYIQVGLSKTGLSSFYSKTQVGSVYQQLNDGARALDLRPYLLSNGTVIFHHGAVHIPIAFEDALSDVVRWTTENPSELVLLLTSHFDYENSNQYYDDPDAMSSALESVYKLHGIAYLSCYEIYGWTIGEAKQACALSDSSKGYILAVDGQDFYGSSCAKENYVESDIVTCWAHNNKTSCKNSQEQFAKLKLYTMASSNNPATDDNSQLGPPYSLDVHPFNEIQALWQVDVHAIAMGLSHFSSILEDNHASNINAEMVDLIYDATFDSVSLFAVDNVAQHGNALLSVLRNACGQSILEDDCGKEIPKPPMRRWRIRKTDVFSVLGAAYAVLIVGVFFYRRPRLLATLWARLRLGNNDSNDDVIDGNQRNKSLLSGFI